MKRINPKTNKVWEIGDINTNGAYFTGYRKNLINQEGYYQLGFESLKSFHRRRVRNILKKRKLSDKKNFNLDLDFLLSIFPKDFICPALKIKMQWGGTRYNSPSLDKINPNKSYTKNNVSWISYKANEIKSNANYKEILKVGRWMKKNGL